MAGGSKKFRRFAVKLHRERVELLTLLATLQSAEPEPGGLPLDHPADVAGDLYNHEERLTLKGWLRQRLAEVDAALERIHDGTYGRCEVCGQPIQQARLAVLPTARTRVDCQHRLEHEAVTRVPSASAGWSR